MEVIEATVNGFVIPLHEWLNACLEVDLKGDVKRLLQDPAKVMEVLNEIPDPSPIARGVLLNELEAFNRQYPSFNSVIPLECQQIDTLFEIANMYITDPIDLGECADILGAKLREYIPSEVLGLRLGVFLFYRLKHEYTPDEICEELTQWVSE